MLVLMRHAGWLSLPHAAGTAQLGCRSCHSLLGAARSARCWRVRRAPALLLLLAGPARGTPLLLAPALRWLPPCWPWSGTAARRRWACATACSSRARETATADSPVKPTQAERSRRQTSVAYHSTACDVCHTASKQATSKQASKPIHHSRPRRAVAIHVAPAERALDALVSLAWQYMAARQRQATRMATCVALLVPVCCFVWLSACPLCDADCPSGILSCAPGSWRFKTRARESRAERRAAAVGAAAAWHAP